VRHLEAFAHLTLSEFTLIPAPYRPGRGNFAASYLDGICAAPEAGTTGATAADAAGAGAVTAAAPSSTLPLVVGRRLPK